MIEFLITLITLSHTFTVTAPANYFFADVTAYSGLDSCHYEGCLAANGRRAEVGIVACPREIELGSSVLLDGEVYECADRTARRFDGRFDVFMGYGEQAHKEAVRWGIKKMRIWVL